MNTGILATACLCLALGQSNGDGIEHTNQRNLRIPVKVEAAVRKDIREFLLYVSTDEGRNWQQAGAIPAEKDFFAFYANRDGAHWLRVAVVNRFGVQDPDDKHIQTGPPDMKMVIDTAQPVIRKISAQRYNDEVYVNWEIQEDNLARDGVRLEYQRKDAAGSWSAVPVTSALNGQAHFRPNHNLPVVVRIVALDKAGNQSFALSEVGGTVTPAGGFASPNNVAPLTPMSGQLPLPKDPTLPAEIQLQAAPPEPLKTINPQPILPVNPPPLQKPLTPPESFQSAPPPPTPPREAPPSVIADSRIPATPPVTPTPPPTPPAGNDLSKEPPFPQRQMVNAPPARKPLPALQYVNNHQVTLEYEVKRVGPSGVGTVELWLTRDDGTSWEPYAAAQDAQSDAPIGRQKRTFDFRDRKTDKPFTDGIFGLNLVVKNRAGIGHQPHPGDVPEIRIEIDTQAPVAVLYQPTPDPHRPDQVLLKWLAKDKNLTTTPINLEYAEKRDGPWQPIQLDLENKGRSPSEEISGEYSWKVPPNTPVQVYLRLRVRDKAGNESIAVTPQPQYVDLTEPEGSLIGVQPAATPR